MLIPRKVAGDLSIYCEIENYDHIKRKLDDLQKAPPKAMKALTSDLKKRVPGWVAAELVKRAITNASYESYSAK